MGMHASGDIPVAGNDRVPFARRWWIYQRERFPIVGHGVLIAAFSFCAVSLSAMLRGAAGLPSWRAMLVAFVTSFIFFLQLRIADEFKDLEEDTRYRPYRPVPRGLVTLRELAGLFAIGAGVQLGLALWLDVRLVGLLAVTWAYLALMSKEFFVGDWLRSRPVVYMVSHMVIMPLVDLYATGADWLAAGDRAPAVLIWFLLASYFNGLVIEMGRKIRSPADEETGVDTYSRIWGRGVAVGAWWAAIGATLALAIVVAHRLGMTWTIGATLGAFAAGAVVIAVIFLRNPASGRGKWIETYAGLWTIALYLGLGLLPRILKGWW